MKKFARLLSISKQRPDAVLKTHADSPVSLPVIATAPGCSPEASDAGSTSSYCAVSAPTPLPRDDHRDKGDEVALEFHYDNSECGDDDDDNTSFCEPHSPRNTVGAMMLGTSADLQLADELDDMALGPLCFADAHDDKPVVRHLDSGAKILQEQKAAVALVVDVCAVTEEGALRLLPHYRWDVERLMAAFTANSAACLAAAGLTAEHQQHAPQQQHHAQPQPQPPRRAAVAQPSSSSVSASSSSSAAVQKLRSASPAACDSVLVSSSASCSSSSSSSSSSLSLSLSSSRSPPAVELATDGECPVCGDSLADPEAGGRRLTRCGHAFCAGCWAGYLRLHVSEGATALHCAAFKCPTTVTAETLRELMMASVDSCVQQGDTAAAATARVEAEQVFERHVRFTAQHFVDQAPQIFWCPRPSCGLAVSVVEPDGSGAVACSCGFAFCTRCRNEAHAPLTCDELRAWQRKNSDTAETDEWLVVNTKPCPKCKTPIEKNDGCLHMTCKNCGYHFCWACLQEFKDHADFYACERAAKRAKKDEALRAKLADGGSVTDRALHPKTWKRENKAAARERERLMLEAKREALLKYQRAFDDFKRHDLDTTALARLRDEARLKQDQLVELHGTNRAQTEFVMTATHTLVRARAALKFSVVAAYFQTSASAPHPQWIGAELFAYLFGLASAAADELHTALAEPVATMSRDRLLVATNAADSRMRALVSACTLQ